MIDFIQGLFTTEFAYGAISSLLAAFIIWAAGQFCIDLIYKSEFSGIWEFRIFDNDSKVIHKDLVKFKHNSKTGMIKGKAKIIEPINSTWKPRKVIGTLRFNRLLVLSYTNQLIQSTSVTHLKLVNEYHFKGYILRYNIDENQIEKMDVDYIKIMPKNKRRKIKATNLKGSDK
jgi:hypothetical protein